MSINVAEAELMMGMHVSGVRKSESERRCGCCCWLWLVSMPGWERVARKLRTAMEASADISGADPEALSQRKLVSKVYNDDRM